MLARVSHWSLLREEDAVDLSKLFGVLVVGGSMLAVGGCGSDEDTGDGRGPIVGAPDAQASADPDAATSSGPDAAPGELVECFCETDACCVRDENGVGTLQPGFECCWGAC
jgi:hypothetical protein